MRLNISLPIHSFAPLFHPVMPCCGFWRIFDQNSLKRHKHIAWMCFLHIPNSTFRIPCRVYMRETIVTTDSAASLALALAERVAEKSEMCVMPLLVNSLVNSKHIEPPHEYKRRCVWVSGKALEGFFDFHIPYKRYNPINRQRKDREHTHTHTQMKRNVELNKSKWKIRLEKGMRVA